MVKNLYIIDGNLRKTKLYLGNLRYFNVKI